jgi:hypothetical protein
MIRLTIKSASLAGLLLTVPFASAEAAELENGRHRCIIDAFSMHLGDIEIDGDVYRGPAYDGAYQGDYNFTVSSEGAITWSGPLGGISQAGNVVSSTVHDAGFDIIIQNDSGRFQTISCLQDW